MNLTIMLQISFELTERVEHSFTLILASVLFCFMLIAIVNFNNSQLFYMVSKRFFLFKFNENNFNDDSRLSFGSVIILNINFFISLLLCTFLFFSNSTSLDTTFFYSFIFSLYIFVIQQLSLLLITFFSKHSKTIDLAKALTHQTLHFGGFIFLVLALFWSLNRGGELNFPLAFILILSFLFSFRFIKAAVLSLGIGIKWYYIILYICSLEILPSFVFYHFLVIKTGAFHLIL